MKLSRHVLPLFTVLCAAGAFAEPPRAYVFFGMDHERIAEPSFLNNKAVEGTQLKYTWKQLEGEPGEYRFDEIRHDLDFLTQHGKRLFIQIQDASFDAAHKPFPKYLLEQPQYHGGANEQFDVPNDDEGRAKPAGWVARRWDPAVRDRWQRLIDALGKEFDGKIEGINLPETAIDVGETGKLYPPDFTPDIYRDAVIDNMRALKRAFPKSVAMQYANFMPEARGRTEPTNLKAVYHAAWDLKVALGGPDLLPYKYYQMENSYPLLRESASRVPTGVAVQDGNLAFIHPKTKARNTVTGALDFATDYLHVTYVFWGTEEPYYSRDVLPFYQGAATRPAR